MKLSVVTTLYKSSEYIEEFYSRITNETKKITEDYEIIFVDDGSPDDSLSKAIKLSEKDHNVKVIELSRNFGHHKAIMAGLESTNSDFVFLLDVDLEELPEWLGDFYRLIITDKCDVVYGQQKTRQGNASRKFFGKIWYNLLNNFFKVDHPHNITTARLMNKNYVDQLKKFSEVSFVISSIWNHIGFNQKAITVHKKFKNKTSYSLKLKMEIIINFWISNSVFPLKLVLFLNLILSFGFLLILIIVTLNKIINNNILDGWTSLVGLIILNYFFISMILTTFGFYLIEITKEVKSRPKYIIKKIYKNNL
jgi:putative glycosyltransferase